MKKPILSKTHREIHAIGQIGRAGYTAERARGPGIAHPRRQRLHRALAGGRAAAEVADALAKPRIRILLLHHLSWPRFELARALMPSPLPLQPVLNFSALLGSEGGNRVTWPPDALVTQIRSC